MTDAPRAREITGTGEDARPTEPGALPGSLPADAWTLFIDGGARGNPGPAGAGAIIYDESGVKVAEQFFPLGHLTNNAAEYEGLLHGLCMARAAGARRIEVRSDSELLVRQMQGSYRTRAKHLKQAAEKARSLLADFTDVRFVAIPRELNIEADLLANKAMDETERNPAPAHERRR